MDFFLSITEEVRCKKEKTERGRTEKRQLRRKREKLRKSRK